jgi:outer membrane immunogenic protein
MPRAIRLGLAIAALIGAAAGDRVMAADLPPAPTYKAPVLAPVAGYNWTGFYVGGNLGGVTEHASGTSDFNDVAGIPVLNPTNPQSNSFSNTHFVGGVQAGYNWQFDPRWVLGVEADWERTRTGYSFCRQTDITSLACADNGDGFETIKSTTDWIATARARLGVTVGNVLLYGTGGAAWGHIETTLSQSCLVGGCGATSSATHAASSISSTIKAGWVAGLGAEAALGHNWSVRTEWLHIDLGTIGNSLTTVGNFVFPSTQTTTWSRAERYDQFRIGFNYKFAGSQ